MQISYQGYITPDGKPHKGLFIASGAGGTKVLIRPGVNEIDDDDWFKIRNTGRISQLMSDGQIRIVKAPRETRKGDGETVSDVAVIEFDELSALEAKKLVAATIDLEVLRGWKESEAKRKAKRSGVRKAIDEQIEKIGDQREINLPPPRGLSPGETERIGVQESA